ncbi:MAG TPA: hypothetical protein PK563_11350 [Tenuifilaceae bacterium]|nr:hypothetical protein [Tenuifilaceae bacterium]
MTRKKFTLITFLVISILLKTNFLINAQHPDMVIEKETLDVVSKADNISKRDSTQTINNSSVYRGSSINKRLIENVNNQNLILENRPEDRQHPEYGKIRLEDSPQSEEIMGMRTANSRTFKNLDGTFTTQQAYGLLHFQKDGQWLTIGNNLSKHRSNQNVLSLSETDLPISIDTGTGATQMQLCAVTGKGISFGNKVSLKIVDNGGQQVKEMPKAKFILPSIIKNQVLAANIWENISRRQTINYWQVKTDYIIEKRPDFQTKEGALHFEEQIELPKDVSVIKGNGVETEYGWQGELLIVDKKNSLLGIIEKPIYFDNLKPVSSQEYSSNCDNAEPIEIFNDNVRKKDAQPNLLGFYQYKLKDNVLILNTVVPLEWLLDESRIYPVTIDPTITNTYSAGNIGSCRWTEVNEVTKIVTIPAGAAVTQTASQWRYNARNGQWRNEVYTRISGNNASYEWFQCNLSSGGDCNLTLPVANNDIANGVYENGQVPITIGITRTWGDAVPGCNDYYSFIVNNTWITTITYATVPTPTVTCSATFTDTGGAGANYSNNETYAVTYQSNDGRNIKAQFTTFNVNNTDYLRIYDGADFLTPVLGQFNNDNGSPGTIVSSGTSLTFLFYSNAATVAAGWVANISCTPTNTYYSYQNGNWEDFSTWTLDPSGTLYNNPSNLVPGVGDKAIILNGRTVKVTSGAKTVDIVDIQDGSILDLQGVTGHNFLNLQGAGRLKLSSASLPSGNMSNFVSNTGGTIEFYGNPAANFTFNRNTFNNLVINFSNTSRVASVGNNTTINGNLTVQSGDFRIGNNTTARTLTNYGDINVESSGKFSVHTQGAHIVNLHGDLTVNSGGTFILHNLATPSYNTAITAGKANLQCVNPTKDQTITANGPIEPYWLVVDKGTDQTYMVDVQASGDFFKLYGHTFENSNSSLNLRNGTLKLGSNVIIPQFIHARTEDYSSVPVNSGQYNIPESAHLWIDGAELTTTNITGTIYRGDLFFVYGKLSISSGSLFDNSHRGIILATNGVVEISGGSLSTSIIRSAWMAGVHRGTYIQSGGSVDIRRDIETTRANGANFNASFMMAFPENVFIMSGGDINILNSTVAGGAGEYFSLILGMNSNNVQVSGGNINITVPDSRDAKLLVTGKIWNLNISSNINVRRSYLSAYAGYDVVTPAIGIQPLVVINDFTISNPARFDAANQNVSIGGDFTIEAGATYIPGTNSTIFNGSAGQAFNNNGNISSGLYNMSVENASITAIDNDLTVRNELNIESGTILRDMGYTISVAGNVTNSGSHISQAVGSITLNGAGAQTIDGNGNGIFGNLRLNKASGSSTLNANISVSGNLRLANTAAIFSIGSKRVTLSENSRIYDALTGTTNTNFSSTRMIQTDGNQSDGGLRVHFNTTDIRNLPLGVGAKYTPARIQFTSAPSQWGYLSVRPVDNAHPHLTSTNALSFYWRVQSSDFAGIASGSLQQRFYYTDGDINGNEPDYLPGRYNPILWSSYPAEKVSIAINEILFDDITQPDGDFTAGEPDAFGVVVGLFSAQTGNWEDPNTWVTDTISNTPAGRIPAGFDPVVIRNGHTVTTSAGGALSGSLQILSEGVLNLGTTTGHNFGALQNGKVSGNGTLRISSAVNPAVFPNGDFGDFLYEGGGTVEYYSTGTNFLLPANIPNYNNLIINSALSNLRSGNTDQVIYGDLIIRGANWTNLNPSDATSYTTTVYGNLIVEENALFRFNNNQSQILTVHGSCTIETGAIFNVNNGTGHQAIFYGDLINNGTLNFYPGNWADAYFLSPNSQTISGAGATTSFYRLYVDKGINQDSVLNVTSSNFSINTALANSLAIQNGTIRFNGPTSTISGVNAFNIPETGRLAVAGGNITVGTDNNNADIILAGKIEVTGGVLNVGQGPDNNYNNDIEIAGGGKPEVEVSGGTLNVNGQIRRSGTSTAGALGYTQSGGTVNIFGRQRLVTRALLEVLNAGSFFNTSGGDINLIRSGGTTFGDLYLNSSNYDLTGGTITIGNAVTPTSTFDIYLGNPVYNLTVDGTTNAKTARLRSFPATFEGSLQIGTSGGVGSSFNTSGLDVGIKINLINYSSASSTNTYITVTSDQTTVFEGSETLQQIICNGSSNLNFANIEISKTSGILSKEGTRNLVINENLYLNQGNLVLTSGDIFLNGDLFLFSSILSSGVGNHLIFSSSISQNIYGTNGNTIDVFRINKSKTVISNVSLNIDRRYRFVTGAVLNMGSNSLTFKNTTNFTGDIGATFNDNTLIQTNGVLSDKGITVEYNAASSFIFPIGVAGKYTPVTVNVTNTGGSAGSVTVKPIDRYHPATQNPLNDELQYYWNVTSEGFGASPTVTHTYTYSDGDALPSDAGYVGGRYYNYQWIPENGISGSVSEAANTITLTGVNYIDGEYTAGLDANFITKPPLYSISTGNWGDGTTWSYTSGGATCNCSPNGNPVFIESNHVVTLDSDEAYAYSVDISELATLAVGTTRQHNLGHVTGGGTIRITATAAGSFIFPGGYFDEFMNTSTSVVDYEGTGTLPSSITTYPNIQFSGSASTKSIPAIDLTILGNLTILEGYLDNTNYNRSITVAGNWTSNVSGGFLAGRGLVTFNGTSSTISATGGETFYKLKIDRSGGGVTLASPVSVTNYLYLTNGIINTTSANVLTLTWSSTNAVVGGSSTSFVDGPLRKNISGGSSFYFPVGNSGRYGRTRIFNTSAATYWTVQYHNSSPSNRDLLTPPLQLISNNEYWSVTPDAARTANIQLRWDGDSDIIPATTSARQKLRVAQWDIAAYPSFWTSVGNRVTDGGVASGTIQTTSPTTFNGVELLTIGLDQTSTAQITGTDAEMCNDGTILPVTVQFTGDGPWEFTYLINGTNSVIIPDVGTSPYNIQFEYDDLYSISGSGDYVISLQSVYDDNGVAGVILSGTATLTVKETPNPIVSGADRVMINSQEVYSVQEVPNESYVWAEPTLGTINGSSIGRSVTIDWGNITGNDWVEVTVSNTVTSCSHTERLDVEIRNWPVISGDFEICAGSEQTYSSPDPGGHTFLWEVVGGTFKDGINNTSSVTVIWGSSAAGSIKVNQSDGGSVEIDERIVTINPIPTASLALDGSGIICDGENSDLLAGYGNTGANYEIEIFKDGILATTYNQSTVPAGNPFTYNTGNLIWELPDVVRVYEFEIYVTNSTTGCSSQPLAVTVEVNVFKIPETGPQYHVPNTYGE